jgi:2-phospho-L-lactate/phosphoenolpyruvate guanylyltransferase
MAANDDWIVIPVKCFEAAKTRLVSVLSPQERSTLARIMLTDVLQAARSVQGPINVALAGSASSVAEYAKQNQLLLIDDEGAGDSNIAVTRAPRHLNEIGACTVLVIASDVPNVLVLDLEGLLRAAKCQKIAIAPALSDGGTNALALDAPLLIEPKFGCDSLVKHRQLANEINIVKQCSA